MKGGYDVAGTLAFADHHRYTAADVAGIDARMKSVNADVVLTTDKDPLRLKALPLSFAAYRVPLQVAFDPPDALMASVMAAV